MDTFTALYQRQDALTLFLLLAYVEWRADREISNTRFVS